jgi:predicted deacylase
MTGQRFGAWTRRGILGLAIATSLTVAGTSRGDDTATWGPAHFDGHEVGVGTKARLSFATERSFTQDSLDVPLLVVRGDAPGPTLCLTAALHGDEVNGVEIVRSVYDALDPEKTSGTVLALPIVNLWGFRNGSRYLADRRDLNRAFPGNAEGSTGARIAQRVFQGLVRRCDALIDLHTGSNQRANVPQVRTDLGHGGATELALHFGVGIVIDGRGPKGSLRREAMDAGIPALLYEAGESLRFQRDEVARGVEGVRKKRRPRATPSVSSTTPVGCAPRGAASSSPNASSANASQPASRWDVSRIRSRATRSRSAARTPGP